MAPNILKTIIFALITPVCFAYAVDGGSDTGGGNICLRGNQAVLLELANDAALTQEKGIKLHSTDLTRFSGMDRIDSILNSAAGKRALDFIQRSSAASPKTAELVFRSLRNIDFFVTEFAPKRALKADFEGYSNCSSANTVASIVYHNGEAYISLLLFNKLDLNSQAAILMHEALRHVQLTYGAEGKDSELQNVTRSLIVNPGVGMDHSPFFKSLIKNNPDLITAWNNYCAFLKAHAPSYNSDVNQKAANFCQVDVEITRIGKNEQIVMSYFFDALDKASGESKTVDEVKLYNNAMIEGANVITYLCSQSFSDATMGIMDSANGLRTSFGSFFVNELRAYLRGERQLSAQQAKQIQEQASQMRTSLRAQIESF